jgi:ribosomal protein S12 methylthiotransferase accessory factor
MNNKAILEPTTSGSGAGTTREGAFLSGLLELIERDHFLLYWFSGIRPPRIDVGKESGPLFDHIREGRERFGLEIEFFNLEYDTNVIVCLAVIIDPILNIVAFGGKASGSLDEAIRASYLEALATIGLVRSRDKRPREELFVRLRETREWGVSEVDKPVRVNLYNSVPGCVYIRETLIGDGTNVISYAELNTRSRVWRGDTEELQTILDSMRMLVREKGEGYHAYVHEFNAQTAREEKYHVAHVFVPSFLKLHLTERYVAPCSERLSEFMRAHGCAQTDVGYLNHMPHPFP